MACRHWTLVVRLPFSIITLIIIVCNVHSKGNRSSQYNMHVILKICLVITCCLLIYQIDTKYPRQNFCLLMLYVKLKFTESL